MAFVFRRSLSIPLWVVALCAVAFIAPSRLPPSFMALLAVALIAATTIVIVRWLRRHTTGAVHVRTFQSMHEAPTPETGDALDLVRTADGGWRVPLKPGRGTRPKKA